MIITIVMFMIFVNTICDQMSGIFFSQLQGMIGGDLQFKVNQLSNKIGKDLKNDDKSSKIVKKKKQENNLFKQPKIEIEELKINHGPSMPKN